MSERAALEVGSPQQQAGAVWASPHLPAILMAAFGTVACGLGAPLLWADLGPVRGSAMLGLGFALLSGLVLAGPVRLWRGWVPPRVEVPVFCTTMSVLVVIGLTGGVSSPFVIVMLPPSMLIGALGVVELGWVPWAMVAGLWLLFVGQLGPLSELLDVPALGGDRPLAGDLLYVTLVSFIVLVGFRIGRRTHAEIAAANLRALQAEQQRAHLQARGRSELVALTGSIAHELKNPLTTLLSLSTHLHRRAEGHGRTRETAVLVEEIKRMRGQVDALLNLSRPTATLIMYDLDLSEVLGKGTRSFQSLAAELGVELRCQVSSVAIRVDERRIRQVIDNLLLNALESSPRGAVVEVHLGLEDDNVILEVLDEGEGLAPELGESLFHPGQTTKPTGSGIGLAVSHVIVEQHGGVLELTNRPERGCSARLSIPR